MNCDEVQELLEAYVLGALEPAAAEQVQVHCVTCPVCHQELNRAWGTVRLLHLAVAPVQPPDRLRTQVLAAARGDLVNQGAGASQGRADRWRRLVSRPPGPAGTLRWAAAAAALPLVVSAWLALQVLSLRQEMNQTTQAVEQNRQTAHVATDLIGKAVQSGASMAKLDGTEMAPQAWGFVYYVPADRQCVLVAEGLPSPDRDHVYQIWLQSGESRMSGGTFMPESGGHGMVVVESPMPLAAVDAVGISLEPRGGSPQPKGSRYMWGRLKRS